MGPVGCGFGTQTLPHEGGEFLRHAPPTSYPTARRDVHRQERTARQAAREACRSSRPYKDPNADPHSSSDARCQPRGNGLLFLLGGTVARVTSLFRALCASLRAVLHARCVVPDVVLRAPCVVPDAVPYQTSASQWRAWRAWWWSGLQQVIPSELQARPQVQTQPRIQKKQERFDDRPASLPNVHPCQAPGLLPACTSHKFLRVGLDLNQPGRWQKNPYRARLSRRTQCPSGARFCHVRLASEHSLSCEQTQEHCS